VTIVTEEVEVADRKAYLMLPQRKIPFLDFRDIRTHQSKYGKEDKYDT